MKRLAILVIGFLIITGCGMKYQWSNTDKVLAGAVVAAQVADGYTTDKVVKLGGYEKYSYGISSRPDTKTIVAWKGVQTVLILGAAHVAPVIHPKLRKIILVGSTGSPMYFVINNNRTIRKMKSDNEFGEWLRAAGYPVIFQKDLD